MGSCNNTYNIWIDKLIVQFLRKCNSLFEAIVNSVTLKFFSFWI